MIPYKGIIWSCDHLPDSLYVCVCCFKLQGYFLIRKLPDHVIDHVIYLFCVFRLHELLIESHPRKFEIKEDFVEEEVSSVYFLYFHFSWLILSILILFLYFTKINFCCYFQYFSPSSNSFIQERESISDSMMIKTSTKISTHK